MMSTVISPQTPMPLVEETWDALTMANEAVLEALEIIRTLGERRFQPETPLPSAAEEAREVVLDLLIRAAELQARVLNALEDSG